MHICYISISLNGFDISNYTMVEFYVFSFCLIILPHYTYQGGIELALLCDMRVMEEDAVMGVFCRRWGVPLLDGAYTTHSKLCNCSFHFVCSNEKMSQS